MIIVVLLISFLLDGFISNLVPLNSFLLPLCTIISLIIIYPYFKDIRKYFIYIIIVGILYDLSYGNISLLNVIIFSLVGLFIKLINYFISNNYFTLLIKILLVIIFYRLISYLISIILGYNYFNFMALFISIYRSLILNIIYGLGLAIITDMISDKYKISKKE